MYRNLRACLDDLYRIGELKIIDEPIDANLEMAAIQRRVFEAGGPALWFRNVKGCRFSMVSNLFGTQKRLHYIFRDALAILPRVLRLGVNPADFMRRPGLYLSWRTPWSGWCSLPKMTRRAPVFQEECQLEELPALKSWPADGGAYITLPQVYTENPDAPGVRSSNLGMYRVQLTGGNYTRKPPEVGIHYQIHRGIGIHHARAIARGERLRVNVFVGGPPAMSIAAIMPLPEGMSELLFAGILNQRRVRMAKIPGDSTLLPVSAEADFALCGYLEPDTVRREGPFGDHLGYYSLTHDFPVMKVMRIFHRRNAIWPFTVVGRPPQEDSMIGEFIHELVRDLMPDTIPGVKEVHAVDDCGVHPLLLAIGSERYIPYENPRRPMELQTLAHAILGTGQLSLAKYLLIVAGEDDPTLTVRDVPRFLQHVLARVDWRNDLHFQTGTTTDTLDYSGGALNRGSKLVVTVAGNPRRELPKTYDENLRIPEHLSVGNPMIPLPGVLVLEAETWEKNEHLAERFASCFTEHDAINRFPFIILVDRHSRAGNSLRDLLWTAFTKSDPARDLWGIAPTFENRHIGFRGSLVLDARRKTFHAPELVEDPEVIRRVEALAAPGGVLHGVF